MDVFGRGERWRSSAAPLALLFLALASMFFLGGDRGHLYRPSNELNHMAVAGNLAPEHHFLGFYRLTPDADGDRTYVPYNRFPVLGHMLIKLVMLPFAGDMSAGLFAARMLMLVFFAAAATTAYLALCRLVRNRWAALAATLLAFSSYYALRYNDMVATEGVIDLFGLMLVFHGMAVFATEGRFGQLLGKTCVALLLGWHVYALLLPFVVLGLAVALRRRDGESVRRHVVLGVVAVGFGSVVLAANFTREYVALGGEVPLAELPSVESMIWRTGFSETKRWGEITWPTLAEQQLGRIGIAWVPYAARYFGEILPVSHTVRKYSMAGLGVVGVLCIVFIILAPPPRHRLPLAALVLSGPCWAVSMRYSTTYHPFEGMFYVGIPLVFFSLMLLRLDRMFRWGEWHGVSKLAGLAAALTFVLSNLLMTRVHHDPEDAASNRILTADVESIRELIKGKTIYAPPHALRYDGGPIASYRTRIDYYYTGSTIVRSPDDRRRFADFVVSGRLEGVHSLTPGNRLLFLYDRTRYDAYWLPYEQHAKDGAPILKSPDYDVYLVERNGESELLYFRGRCPERKTLRHEGWYSSFFLHVYPADTNDLPADRRRFGFDSLPLYFDYWREDGRCYSVRRLPDYDIARIRTGQFRRDTGGITGVDTGENPSNMIWEGSFLPVQAEIGVLD